jgi:methylisocitrate lyase
MTSLTAPARLRQLLAGPDIVVAPGTYDALSAKIAAQAGFAAIYVSGAALSASLLGLPDLGFTSLGEVVDQIRRIAGAVDVPVIADADTGFGNALSVSRTIREYERAGVAALHLEDQVFPKRCGHFEGKQVIPAEEMVQKLRAAVDARQDLDFVIIARTDARATHGLDEALRRARLYQKAGADVIFVEAPRDLDELRRIAREIDGPLLANMVEGGKTPLLSAAELQALGFKLVILPGTLQRTAAKAMQAMAAEITRAGTSRDALDRLVTFEGRNLITGLAECTEMERRYTAPSGNANAGAQPALGEPGPKQD